MKAAGNGTDALDQGTMQPGKIKILDAFFSFFRIMNVQNVLYILLQDPYPVGHGQGYAFRLFNGPPTPGNSAIGAGTDALITLVSAWVEMHTLGHASRGAGPAAVCPRRSEHS